MQTNLTTEKDPQLHEAARALLDAAYKYWQEYQRVCGRAPVVWLKDNNGHMVVFTRSEYGDTIMRNIDRLSDEIPLCEEAAEQLSRGEEGV